MNCISQLKLASQHHHKFDNTPARVQKHILWVYLKRKEWMFFIDNNSITFPNYSGKNYSVRHLMIVTFLLSYYMAKTLSLQDIYCSYSLIQQQDRKVRVFYKSGLKANSSLPNYRKNKFQKIIAICDFSSSLCAGQSVLHAACKGHEKVQALQGCRLYKHVVSESSKGFSGLGSLCRSAVPSATFLLVDNYLPCDFLFSGT